MAATRLFDGRVGLGRPMQHLLEGGFKVGLGGGEVADLDCHGAKDSQKSGAKGTLRRWVLAISVIGQQQALPERSGRDGRLEGLDQRTDGIALELERGLVDHQARADVHDVLDLDQVVGLEGVAGGHQIDDGIGQAGQGAPAPSSRTA